MTIINNNAVSSVELLRVDNPFCDYVYPDSKKPISNGHVYFGQVGQDPTQPENQKAVYAIQENGSYVLAEQPVRLGQGGVPMYDNQPTVLATDGAYSLAVHDSHGAQVYYRARVEHQSWAGIGDPDIIEENASPLGFNVWKFATIDLQLAEVYLQTPSVDGVTPLKKDRDYTITAGSTSQLQLTFTPSGGGTIFARQNVFTKQASSAYPKIPVFDTEAEASAADLDVGESCLVNGEAAFDDGLAATQYRVVTGGTGTGYRYVNMANGNQLLKLKSRPLLQSYSETTAAATLNAGVLTLDLAKGTVFTVTLTESVSSITFANATEATSVTLYVTQDGTGGRGISFTGFKAAAAPTISSGAGEEDVLVFTSQDSNTWYVFQSAENVVTL